MGGSCCSASKSQVNQPTMVKKKANTNNPQFEEENLLQSENQDQKNVNIGQYFFEYFKEQYDIKGQNQDQKFQFDQKLQQFEQQEQRKKDNWSSHLLKNYQKYKAQQQNNDKNTSNKNKIKILSQKNTNYFYIQHEKEMLCFKSLDSQMFITLLRNNPPHCYRWAAWKSQLHNEGTYDPQLYDQLLKCKNKFEYDIEKDVHRTFPEHPYFKKDSNTINTGNTGQDQLFRVLKAISNYFPNLGYTQGMNFIVGFTLMINGGKEVDSFWFFVNMATDPDFFTLGFFSDQFPHLHYVIFVLKKCFEQYQPKVYQHFEDMGMPDQMWIWKWLLTSFLYSFPLDLCVKFWDFIISSGVLSLISLSMAIIDQFKNKFLELDFAELSLFFSELKVNNQFLKDESHDLYLNVEKLFQEARKIKISRKQMEEYTKQYMQVEHSLPVDKQNRYLKFYSQYNVNYKQALQDFRDDMKNKGEIVDKQMLLQKLELENSNPNNLLESTELKSYRKDSIDSNANSNKKKQQEMENIQEEDVLQDQQQQKSQDDNNNSACNLKEKQQHINNIVEEDQNNSKKNIPQNNDYDENQEINQQNQDNAMQEQQKNKEQQQNSGAKDSENQQVLNSLKPLQLYQFSSDSVRGNQVTIQQQTDKKDLSVIGSEKNINEENLEQENRMNVSDINIEQNSNQKKNIQPQLKQLSDFNNYNSNQKSNSYVQPGQKSSIVFNQKQSKSEVIMKKNNSFKNNSKISNKENNRYYASNKSHSSLKDFENKENIYKKIQQQQSLQEIRQQI